MRAIAVQNVPPLNGAPAPPDLIQLLLTLGLLVLVILVGLLVIAVARRWLLGLGEKRGHAEEMAELLQGYRRLRDEGVISQEEYARIRAAMLGRGAKEAAEARVSWPREIRERPEAGGPEAEGGGESAD